MLDAITTMTARSMAPPYRRFFPRVAVAALHVLIALVCLARIVPFSPDMPRAGLDGAWRFALEQAGAQALVPGRDIVFTFGPYASVYTRNYHPDTATLMLLASACLALSYAVTLSLFVSGGRRGWLLLQLFLIAALAYRVDSLFFLLPLLVGLQVRQRWPAASTRGERDGAIDMGLLLLLFVPFGLLPLIKGTFLALCALVAGLSAAYLYSQHRRRLAGLCLLVPSLATPLFWCLSGQPLAALPTYFAAMLPIMSGYNDAMSYDGVLREPLLAVAGIVVLLLAVARLPELDRRGRIFLLMLFAGVLFVGFKAGFVRQDGHTVITSTLLLMATVALAMSHASRRIWLTLALVMLPWLIIDHDNRRTTPASAVASGARTFGTAWSGARRWLREPGWPRQQFDATLRDLSRPLSLPLLAGSSDIYPIDLVFLIASGNRWAPRPVLQSYSAYTPQLEEMNRRHLLAPSAPENIFFRIDPIDERLPALDDGASWPLLLSDYRLAALQNGTAILRHYQPAGSVQTPLALPAAPHQFGEAVPVPTAARVYAQLRISPSLPGRLAALLFRPSRINVDLTLTDGRHISYRLVPGMAEAGFLLSPLVETTAEFSSLYGGGLPGKQVRSLKLSTARGFQWFWQARYTIIFQLDDASHGNADTTPHTHTRALTAGAA